MANDYISRLFGTSPVRPIQEHVAQASKCAMKLVASFEAVIDSGWERAATVRQQIDAFSAASIRYRIADGPDAGQRTLSLGSPSLAQTDSPKPLTVDRDGLSLNAG